MDFVLVLILAFLSTGQSYNKDTEQKCYELCPAGFYKVGECDAPAKYRCEKCDNNSFTAEANSINKCERCSTCSHNMESIKNCTRNSNVVCDCKEGYYRKTKSHDSNHCLKCKDKSCEDENKYLDYKKKCPSCQSLEKPTHLPPSTNSSTAASTSTSPATRTTASKNTSNPFVKSVPPKMNEMSWLFLVVVLVTLLLFLWLLLLFARSPFRYPDSCLCRSVNKRLDLPLEDPDISEQSSHQGSSPNTLTLNISEHSPMMTLSQNPATAEHLTHISSQEDELKAIRQHVQSDHWPAIVLYAIIKEVPLRRWKEFLRLLSVTDQQLERVELDAGLGLCSMERQYQMLRLWSQCSSVSLNDVFGALHYMDLSGCAQLLQESLEKLQFAGLN